MVTLLELLGYVAVFAILRLVWFRLADGGRDGMMALAVIAAGLIILTLILSGVDWSALGENWQDLVANGLIAAAVVSVVLGYARLVSAARRRAEHNGKDEDGSDPEDRAGREQ